MNGIRWARRMGERRLLRAAGFLVFCNVMLVAGYGWLALARGWDVAQAQPLALMALTPASPAAFTADARTAIDIPGGALDAAADEPTPALAPASAPAAADLFRNAAPAVLPLEHDWPTPAVTSGMTYGGRPIRAVRTLRMKVTAYSPDEQSCGKWADGITASGFSVWTNGMKLVAADTSLLPFGSILTIPGYHDGKPVPVLDRGGKIKGHRLDVLYPTHAIARTWGVRELDVTVWEYAD